MSACCVSGCKNQLSSTNKLKFYRIPFQANRRRLWLEAIQKVNGSTKQLERNARVCGAHFISGEASMNPGSPDFVPSVFSCANQNRNPKKKAKWFLGRRKRRRHTANVGREEKTAPPRDESPVDPESSVVMEETDTPSSPSAPKKGEKWMEAADTKTETKTIESQTSSQNKASPSLKLPAGFTEQDNRFPIVLLKPIFAPGGEYQCELCDEKFTFASQLVKHVQLHEEKRSFNHEICEKVFTSEEDLAEYQHVHEASFPCNMCDRSFTTSHNLKRHKLLHVKDGRKCGKCGVLFCREHNHILFLPQTEPTEQFESEAEEDCVIIESQDLDTNLVPENGLLEKPETNETVDLEDDAQGTVTTTHLCTTTEQTASPAPTSPGPLSKKPLNALPPASHTRILTEIPVPVLIKHSPALRPHLPLPRYSRDEYPEALIQPQLPPTLKIFSPHYLTSAFFEVKRNYEYILSKPIVVKEERMDIVKEERCERPPTPPVEETVKHVKKEKIAYDLEIVL